MPSLLASAPQSSCTHPLCTDRALRILRRICSARLVTFHLAFYILYINTSYIQPYSKFVSLFRVTFFQFRGGAELRWAYSYLLRSVTRSRTVLVDAMYVVLPELATCA